MRLTNSVLKGLLVLQIAWGAACTGGVLEPDEATRRPGSATGQPAGSDSTGDPGHTDVGGGAGGEAGAPVATHDCNADAIVLQSPRVWRLTHAQLKNTLIDAFGYAGTKVDSLPPDGAV